MTGVMGHIQLSTRGHRGKVTYDPSHPSRLLKNPGITRKQLAAKKFAAELDRLGYPSARRKFGMVRTGLGLASDDDIDQRV